MLTKARLLLILLCAAALLSACATGSTTNVKRYLPICGDRSLFGPQEGEDTEHTKYFRVRSKLLSDFWGRDVFIEAGVVLPPGYRKTERLPVCFSIHGFGGNHGEAWYQEEHLVREGYPRMIYVFPNAMFEFKHHVFANSANNGPWADAFVTEFIPAVEAAYGAYGKPEGRFLTGHSSGGWSSLWLQVAYPDHFGGTWSRAPDPVDFRDFSGVDIYRSKNLYTAADGRAHQMIRHDGRWVMSFARYVKAEMSACPQRGQMDSFEYVFSPAGRAGAPLPLFDRATGEIDPAVRMLWKHYDISEILRTNWDHYRGRLEGKLHIFVGSWDQFRLEGAVTLLGRELERLGSSAEVVVVPERGHFNLAEPHAEHWPQGLPHRIHTAMAARFDSDRQSP